MTIPRPQALLDQLVTATRILVHEGVMDVFGHVALRDPSDPGVFWLARAGAPAARGLCAGPRLVRCLCAFFFFFPRDPG